MADRSTLPFPWPGLALALGIGALGGALFWWLNVPLAWMLGAMTATGLAALLQVPVRLPDRLRNPFIVVMGAMLGTSFNGDMLGGLRDWLLPLAILVPFLLVAGGSAFVYLSRVAGLSRPTAFYSAMPGGLVDMILMGEKAGGDPTTISLMHAARIFLVVMLVPVLIQFVTGADLAGRSVTWRPLAALGLTGAAWFAVSALIGARLGRLLHLPAPLLIGPMLVSAGLHASDITDFQVPSVILAGTQVILGAGIGCRFAGTSPARILRVLGHSLGATTLLLITTILFGLALAHLTAIPFAEALLAYAPGGLAEMSLIAFTLGLEVPFVAALHIARIFMTVTGVTLLERACRRR
ncbi:MULTISPECIES: AbrB family transcriptional regulator [unclassified Meridianimarinicoccus]|uniref:AbrB family transcriptional regulator n=1 Tax=unclassified Meridianimarinicoccus TaxID=2923344 RepID=UPI001867B7CF|nr:AbrB family transcriptional regulator [Fluviibacterium sp. MJW13]